MNNVYTYNEFKMNENGDSFDDEVLIDRIEKQKKEVEDIQKEIQDIESTYKEIKSKYNSIINTIIKGNIPNIKTPGKPTDGEIRAYLKSNDIPASDADMIVGYLKKVDGIEVLNTEKEKISSNIAELEKQKNKNVS